MANPDAQWRCLIVIVLFALSTVGAQAAINIDTVPVGNLGNIGELSGSSAGGSGPSRVCGAVEYAYSIGKFEVTIGQYTEFLNAVATTDSYGLYNTGMYIQRRGSQGSYSYSPEMGWADRPVCYVSWGDAARFANWLHNGQPTGQQDLTTTEDGAYFLNGTTYAWQLARVNREADWQWAVPTEDEWYKAAYHKNDGDTGNYFDYATGSNLTPSNDLTVPDRGNNATYYKYYDYTIGFPYFRTEVGAHENSESPYGTFDQSGNVWEWNEYAEWGYFSYGYRGARGGSFSPDDAVLDLHAAARGELYNAATDFYNVGFRVVTRQLIPEPGSVLVWAGLGAIGLMRRRRRN